MWKEVDQSTQDKLSQQIAPASSPRRRDQVLQNIKLELATGGELSLGERTRGFDPYNSKLGNVPRADVWDKRRRA